VAWQDVRTSAALLEGSISWGSLRAKETIKVLESILGPDNKSTNMSTRSELEKVEGINWAELNTREVTETLDETRVVLVAHKWAATHGVATVTPLTTASAKLLGGSALLNIIVSTDSLKDLDSGLGLVNGLNVVSDNKWDLWELAHFVTTCLNESWESRSSESRSGSITALVFIDAAVPSAPYLGWGEHATLAAHVTEGTLTGSVGTTTRDTRDT
jgi:hypothetical protein